MTDVDQFPTTTPDPWSVPSSVPPTVFTVQPRGGRSRWWWIAGVVVAGSAIGAGLGRWDSDRTTSAEGSGATSTTQASGSRAPTGLIGGEGTVANPPPTHTIDNRVFVDGDSVMQGAAPYLATDLPTWSIIADTKVGRFLDEANSVILKRQKDIGKVVVLNLGNNYNGDKAQFAQQVTTTMTELAGVEHVIWMNVAEYQSNRADVNDVLTQAAATHPNLTIVDWNALWLANRSYTGADHLHLTDDGAKAYASLVSAAVAQVTQAAGEVPTAGVSAPDLNTSGTIPGSRSTRSTTAYRTRPRTTVRAPATTLGTAGTGSSPQSGGTGPTTPANPGVTSDTAPKSTAPSTPPATPAVPAG